MMPYHSDIHESFALAHLFSIHNGSSAATKAPHADGDAVSPCCYRVLAAASVGPLATAYFAEFFKGEVRRIHILRTRVNSALEELEDGLVDRGVPFDS
jgi:hypothetical protein